MYNEVVYNFSSQGKSQSSGLNEPVSHTLFAITIFASNTIKYPTTYMSNGTRRYPLYGSSPIITNLTTTDANLNFNRSLLGTFTSTP